MEETLYNSDDLAILLQRVSNDVYNYLKSEKPEDIVFVGILTNGLFFAKRIQTLLQSRHYSVETPVMGLDISLYRDDLGSKKAIICQLAQQVSRCI